jgi:hypothetical protein
MDITQTLLGLIASLIGAGIWVVKSLLARSDRLIEARDKQIGVTIDTLGKAVDSFRHYQREETEAHAKILSAIEALKAGR